MQKVSRFLALIVAALFAAPAANATWYTWGSFEPDTPQDVGGGYMYAGPDIDPNPAVKKVYFNVVPQLIEPVLFASVSPNAAGELQSRLLPDGYYVPYAFLGVWKDCNQDNFIGYGAGALFEYASELLSDPGVCPPDTAHNKDGWVYEFLWIGPTDNAFDPATAQQRAMNDTGAAVWGDRGLAGGPVGGDCYANPPTGTFSSTGAILGWQDCDTDHGVARAINEYDPTGELAFEDPEYPACSTSLLNQGYKIFADDPRCPTDRTGLWEEGTDDPAFTVWDCNSRVPARDPTAEPGEQGDLSQVKDPTNGELSGPIVMINDSTGLVMELTDVNTSEGLVEVFSADDQDRDLTFEDGYYLRTPMPTTAPTVNPVGSYYDATNGAWNRCGFGGTFPYLSPEYAVTAGSYNRETNWALEFRDDWTDFGQQDATLGEESPTFLGITALRTAFGTSTLGPGWSETTASRDSVLLRGDLTPGGAVYYTWYARITLSGVQLAGGGKTGVYGSEWCGTSTSDIVNGFDCNPDNWWREDRGASVMPTETYTDRPYGQKPGASYNLRDIDCYDGRVADGIYVGAAPVTGDACAVV